MKAEHLVRTFSNRNARRIVVALSGGVDSSVAAALLQRETSSASQLIQAIHMSNWASGDDDSIESCTEQDWKDAQAVARHLKINITRQYFETDYWNHVFDPFLRGMAEGKMGNPDVGCNLHVKFGSLRRHVKDTIGSDVFLATGHYARLWHRRCDKIPEYLEEALERDYTNEWVLNWGEDDAALSTKTILLAGADKSKDQSYFLSACTSDQLSNVLFPLGDCIKNDSGQNEGSPTVRELARKLSLPNAEKKESMGICFVGKRRGGFAGFVSDYLPLPTSKLEFVDVDTGEVLETSKTPTHAALYTIGQGAKLGGRSQKYFVADFHDHRIFVCQGTHHPALYCNSLQLDSINWITNQLPRPLYQQRKIRLQCRIRHLQPLVDCDLICMEDGSFNVFFDKAVRGITIGQMCVFYALDGQVCLGGGAIAQKGPSYFDQGIDLPSQQYLHPSGHNDLSLTPKCG